MAVFHHSYASVYDTTLVYENLSYILEFLNPNLHTQAHHMLLRNTPKYTYSLVTVLILKFSLRFISIPHFTAIFQASSQHGHELCIYEFLNSRQNYAKFYTNRLVSVYYVLYINDLICLSHDPSLINLIPR